MSNNLENTLQEISNKVRNTVFHFLLKHLKNDKLRNGAVNAAAIKFHVHRSTIFR